MDLLHTYYKLAAVSDYPGQPNDTPIYTPDGVIIATVPAQFAYDLSIEGAGKLDDGRVVNYASSGGSCLTTPGYQGIRSCYRVLDPSRYPWGAGHNVALEPLRSIAVDPSVIPWGSTVYIQEFDGLQIPSIGGVGGFTHDGIFRAEDSGGGIHGNHIDIYAGPNAMYRWLESRIPTSFPNGTPLHATILGTSAMTSAFVGVVAIALIAAGTFYAWEWYQGRARHNPEPTRRTRTRASRMEVRLPRRWTRVTSLADASHVVQEYINERGWGASDWYPHANVGLVVQDGRPIAHVSYNGRIWEVDTQGRSTMREIQP